MKRGVIKMMKKSKKLLDSLDVKVLKLVEKGEKPMMKYMSTLKITHSTFNKKIKYLLGQDFIRYKALDKTSKTVVITQKGKKVLKFIETYFK